MTIHTYIHKYLIRVSPALNPQERPSHTHTPKTGFEERWHEVYNKHVSYTQYVFLSRVGCFRGSDPIRGDVCKNDYIIRAKRVIN